MNQQPDNEYEAGNENSDAVAKYMRVYRRCLYLRRRSDSLITRAHRLIVESDVLSCVLRLHFKKARISHNLQQDESRKRNRIYTSAIGKLKRYGEK